MKENIIQNKCLNRLQRGFIPTLCAVLVGISAASQLKAQNYGINFLGNTSDNVTSVAGVVPIPGWNNIPMSFSSGSIASSDNSVNATLTMSGAGWPGDGGWHSGLTSDGANNSLLDGYVDSGSGGNGGATATITGLTSGQLFNVYVYTFADTCRPQNNTDKLPNFSVNGITDYVPALGIADVTYTVGDNEDGGGFNGFVEGMMTNVNINQQINPANYGNYIAISNVVPSGGAITIGTEADGTSFRSPLCGIEIVDTGSGQVFGVKFLGNTSDSVTGTAGVVPIGNWNNITNSFTSGSIASSDNSVNATLTMSGGGWPGDGGWKSGLTGDGANLSLLDGYVDSGSGANGSATATISGLTGSSYTVYIYCMEDNANPTYSSGMLLWLPNYSVNGTTYYTAVRGVGGSSWTTLGSVGGYGFDGFVQATTTSANNNNPPSPANFGNYIAITNVSSGSGGQITVQAEPDATSFRSPLCGIEIVPNSGPSFGVKFLGDKPADTVTGTAGVVPIGDWNNINNATFTSGTITGSDGSTTATLGLTGSGATRTWDSGITGGDGANNSLMHGFIDAGSPGTAIATITGLPASTTYTVYIYCLADSSHPENNTIWLPNYSVNATTYYAPVLGGIKPTFYISTAAAGGFFNGFVKGTTTNANSTLPNSAASFGNYIEYSQVPAAGGQITVQSEPDTSTFRSALNGIELVAVPPTLNLQQSGTNVVLNWSAGTLLQATNVTGPWTTNSTAPPFSITNSPTAPQMFYRVAVQ